MLAAVDTVASVFYHLRWVARMFQRGEPVPVPATAGVWSSTTAYAAASASIALGVTAGPLLDLVTGQQLMN